MLQLGQKPRFAEESGSGDRVGEVTASDGFDGDLAAEHFVVADIDPTHSALPQGSHQPDVADQRIPRVLLIAGVDDDNQNNSDNQVGNRNNNQTKAIKMISNTMVVMRTRRKEKFYDTCKLMTNRNMPN